MSEFKFSCPQCGQHLLAGADWMGRHIQCPSCQRDVIVPSEIVPSELVGESIEAGSVPPSWRQSVKRPPPLPTSAARTQAEAQCGLATVSLVLTLLALPLSFATVITHYPVGLLACVPGLICGHIALRRLRGSPRMVGRAFALTAVIGGYVFASMLLLAALSVPKISEMAETSLAGLNSPLMQPISPTARPPGPMARPSFRRPPEYSRVVPPPAAPPGVPSSPPQYVRPYVPPPPVRPNPSRPFASAPATRAADPKVTTNPQTAPIPMTPVSGRLGGQAFYATHATLQGDMLKFVQGTSLMPDFEVTVFLFGQAHPGQTLLVPNQDPSASSPHVHLRWKDAAGPNSTAVARDYVMRLELGAASGNVIPGRIYLELPQSYQTRLAGTFRAQLMD